MLKEEVAHQLRALHEELQPAGELISAKKLGGYYTLFAQRFGPERLANLDGRELLLTMHAFRQDHRDSVVYWLEFKNDDEFPSRLFGSISGGSALKFGIYQRKEDGVWMTGSPQKQVELTEEEAIEVARDHRQQITAGTELIRALPERGSDDDYRQLQEKLNEVAPDISDSAWAHKYFHLLFPKKLDDFHVHSFQRFHLIKILIPPPAGQGRYLSAPRFVEVAAELDLPMQHLATLLNRRNGQPHRYWRIGTTLGERDSRWDMMRTSNSVAIGWPDLGNLSHISYNRQSKELIREALRERYPSTPQDIGKKAQQIFNFVAVIGEGDLVLACQGMQVLGIGEVVGEYSYVDHPEMPHRRPVRWLSLDNWQLPQREGLRTTVSPIRKHEVNLIEIERQILMAKSPDPSPTNGARHDVRLEGIPGRVQSVLDRKKQVILYGPPGTGKTYWARIAAQDLAAHRCFGRPFVNLEPTEQDRIWRHDGKRAPLVRMCTFHPAYGYEDFIEGYHPETVDQQLVFERRNGIFKQLCEDACQHPDLDYFLIVDEINRGDIPRIFGELLTILEKDKRGQEVLLPLSGVPFSAPPNVYVIGTMNTADRSIALLDTALRRRFGFIELMPDTSVLKGVVVGNAIPLASWLASLNERILQHVGRDARNLQIGHAYLLHDGRPVVDFSRFARMVRDDIIPLLEEYCYEDYQTLGKILGDVLVDERNQRIRQELFLSERRDDLIDGLLRPSPDLIATHEMVTSQAESTVLEAEDADAVDDEDSVE